MLEGGTQSRVQKRDKRVMNRGWRQVFAECAAGGTPVCRGVLLDNKGKISPASLFQDTKNSTALFIFLNYKSLVARLSELSP